jgi:hypothetical protein
VSPPDSPDLKVVSPPDSPDLKVVSPPDSPDLLASFVLVPVKLGVGVAGVIQPAMRNEPQWNNSFYLQTKILF